MADAPRETSAAPFALPVSVVAFRSGGSWTIVGADGHIIVYVASRERADFIADCINARAEPGGAPASECTCIGGSWCAIHGDCTCTDEQRQGIEPHADDCPLHGPSVAPAPASGERRMAWCPECVHVAPFHAPFCSRVLRDPHRGEERDKR
jgi:hypothetical protein